MGSDARGDIRLAVIGFGRMGAFHATTLRKLPGVRLAGVCDSDPEARDLASRLHEVPTVVSVDQLLEMNLDGVLIASNSQFHAEQIRTFAQAGLAIFAEKPLALSLEDAELVYRAVQTAGIPFQVGFQRRWDSQYIEMKRMITQGLIGDPVLFRAYGRDPTASSVSKWGLDVNGGLFLNCAIHDYDIARFFFEREVDTVSAAGSVLVHEGLAAVGDIDACASTLIFGGGGMAVTEWTRFASYGYDVYAEMLGTDGVIQLGAPQTEGTIKLRQRQVPRDGSAAGRFAQAFRASIAGFVESLRNGTQPTPDITDALAALRIAITARHSFEAGSSQTGCSFPDPG